MSAIRLARAVTGRELILKFAGAYHGHVDGLLAEAGSGLATQGIPASPGVPAAAAAATVIVPWNDRDALTAATEQHELAAILAEPVPANMGVVPPAPGFLELLRERATRDRRAARSSTRSSPASASRAAARRSSTASRPTSRSWARSLGGGLPGRRLRRGGAS